MDMWTLMRDWALIRHAMLDAWCNGDDKSWAMHKSIVKAFYGW